MKVALRNQDVRNFADPVWDGSKPGNAPVPSPSTDAPQPDLAQPVPSTTDPNADQNAGQQG
ncbi:hypothetical protein FL583_09470 [Cryptosporangium phraense]|uniref:Uncharacterized protein n=1 Tax=Cryptosporangium phraense TaxID=2593070 RepID=A0A545AXJ3_9ACTN|nr:hypothetical protein FL583_09470 [Cryptosporangium phraense]